MHSQRQNLTLTIPKKKQCITLATGLKAALQIYCQSVKTRTAKSRWRNSYHKHRWCTLCSWLQLQFNWMRRKIELIGAGTVWTNRIMKTSRKSGTVVLCAVSSLVQSVSIIPEGHAKRSGLRSRWEGCSSCAISRVKSSSWKVATRRVLYLRSWAWRSRKALRRPTL